jgi:hypothetical protein
MSSKSVFYIKLLKKDASLLKMFYIECVVTNSSYTFSDKIYPSKDSLPQASNIKCDKLSEILPKGIQPKGTKMYIKRKLIYGDITQDIYEQVMDYGYEFRPSGKIIASVPIDSDIIEFNQPKNDNIPQQDQDAEPIVAPVVKPVVQPVVHPVVEPVVEPVVKSVAEFQKEINKPPNQQSFFAAPTAIVKPNNIKIHDPYFGLARNSAFTNNNPTDPYFGLFKTAFSASSSSFAAAAGINSDLQRLPSAAAAAGISHNLQRLPPPVPKDSCCYTGQPTDRIRVVKRKSEEQIEKAIIEDDIKIKDEDEEKNDNYPNKKQKSEQNKSLLETALSSPRRIATRKADVDPRLDNFITSCLSWWGQQDWRNRVKYYILDCIGALFRMDYDGILDPVSQKYIYDKLEGTCLFKEMFKNSHVSNATNSTSYISDKRVISTIKMHQIDQIYGENSIDQNKLYNINGIMIKIFCTYILNDKNTCHTLDDVFR